jgi:hypothetical protein
MMKQHPIPTDVPPPLHYEDEEVPLKFVFDDDDIDDTDSVESSMNDIDYLHQSSSSFNNYSSSGSNHFNMGGSSAHSATSVLSYESSFNDKDYNDDLDDDDDDDSFATEKNSSGDDNTTIDSYRMNAKKQFAADMIKHSHDSFGPSAAESLHGDSGHTSSSSIYYEGINDVQTNNPESEEDEECVLDIQIPLRADKIQIPRKCRKTDIDQLLLKKNQGAGSGSLSKAKMVDPSKLKLSSSLLESLSGQLSVQQPSSNSHQLQSKHHHNPYHRHRRNSKEDLLKHDSAHSIRSLLSLDKIIEEQIKAGRRNTQAGGGGVVNRAITERRNSQNATWSFESDVEDDDDDEPELQQATFNLNAFLKFKQNSPTSKSRYENPLFDTIHRENSLTRIKGKIGRRVVHTVRNR